MNSYSKSFGYNIFSVGGVIIASIPISVCASYAVNSSYLWMVLIMVYYFLLLAFGYWVRNNQESLIIDQSGITLKGLFGDSKSISWSDVGGYRCVTKGFGKSKKHGIGIVEANYNSNVILPEDYDKGPYIMFIETALGNIAGSKDAIMLALQNGIDCYVNHRNIITHDFVDDEERLNLWEIGNGILLILFAFMCVYINYQYENIHSELYGELIKHSLIAGGNFSNIFSSEPGVFIFFGMGAIMALFFPRLLINRQFKGAICCLVIALILLFTGYNLTIPERKILSENCRDLDFQHADTITAVVDYTSSGGRSGYHTFFQMEYDSTVYRIQTDYVKDATKGMPMSVIVQKGSLNIPVITMVEIRGNDFHWKRNFLGNVYNKLAYQYAEDGDLHRALETIDKAIAIDSTIANYYDTKGEFLLRNGDNNGAVRMWMKVVTIDPYVVNDNNSWLQKQLINLGLISVSRQKVTRPINKTQEKTKENLKKDSKESTIRYKTQDSPKENLRDDSKELAIYLKTLEDSKESKILWDTENRASKWIEDQIIINNKNLGRWTVLESSSVDPIISTTNYEKIKAAPKYGMMLAYQTRPARVLILVGERNGNNPGVYISVDPPMDKEVKVWFGQRQKFFHPIRCNDIHGVYELNESESRQFILNAQKTNDLTFVSVRKGTHVVIVHSF